MLHSVRSLSRSYHLDSLIFRLSFPGKIGRWVEEGDDLEEGQGKMRPVNYPFLPSAPQVIYYVPDLLGLVATGRWV